MPPADDLQRTLFFRVREDVRLATNVRRAHSGKRHMLRQTLDSLHAFGVLTTR
jgi:hypothetical protein